MDACHRRKVAGMRNLWRKLPPYCRAAIEILIVAGILAGVAVALNLWLTDAARGATKATTSTTEIARIKDVIGIVQAFVWAFAILAGGVFAYRKLELFRDFEPHLTVTHAVSHRPVGQHYLHIAVTVTLHNSSKVKIDVKQGYIQLSQISPIDDETVKQKYAEVFGNPNAGDVRNFRWIELDTMPRASDDDALVIEPGESHTELGEFIVSDEVKTVLVYSYFYNSRHSGGARSAPGWTASTVYDIMVGVQNRSD